MISFRVDGRSGVPPYLQLVQQVRQALRMGVLKVGDQLPTVREVVAAVGGEPQHRAQGLPGPGARGPGGGAGRAGHVRARPGRLARRRGTHSRLGRSLAQWVREAARPGLTTRRSSRCCRVTLQATDLSEEEIA